MRIDPRSFARRLFQVLAVFAVANALALGALALFTRTAHATAVQGEVHAAATAPPAIEWGGVLDLQKRLKDLRTERDDRGNPCFVLDTPEGEVRLTPEEFHARLAGVQEEQRGNALYRLFNITTPWGFLWVSLGFLGQALFTFRMVLQWYASEKEKRSVVPVGFWWGSLFGGLMLFVYFVWRKDIVGILGQSTGVFVYARNLVLIYRARAAETAARAARTTPA